MTIVDRYKHTGDITRKEHNSDGQGGFTDTTTTVASVSCRLSVVSASRRDLGNQVQSTAQYVVFMGTGTSVKIRDIITISSTAYEVMGIRLPSRGNHQELDVQRIDVGA